MKALYLALFTALLAACAAPAAPTALPAELLPASTVAPSAEPQAEQPAPPSFEAVTYEDPLGRFTVEYPASWQVMDGEGGARGSYVQILSWDPGAAGYESVPAGESLLQIATYQWDPKGDLSARLDMRRTALQNSGITIAEETQVAPEGGPAGVRMRLISSGEESLTYFFVLGDEYLEISGIGDLQLLDQVIQTFEYAK